MISALYKSFTRRLDTMRQIRNPPYEPIDQAARNKAWRRASPHRRDDAQEAGLRRQQFRSRSIGSTELAHVFLGAANIAFGALAVTLAGMFQLPGMLLALTALVFALLGFPVLLNGLRYDKDQICPKRFEDEFRADLARNRQQHTEEISNRGHRDRARLQRLRRSQSTDIRLLCAAAYVLIFATVAQVIGLVTGR